MWTNTYCALLEKSQNFEKVTTFWKSCNFLGKLQFFQKVTALQKIIAFYFLLTPFKTQQISSRTIIFHKKNDQIYLINNGYFFFFSQKVVIDLAHQYFLFTSTMSPEITFSKEITHKRSWIVFFFQNSIWSWTSSFFKICIIFKIIFINFAPNHSVTNKNSKIITNIHV